MSAYVREADLAASVAQCLLIAIRRLSRFIAATAIWHIAMQVAGAVHNITNGPAAQAEFDVICGFLVRRLS